MPNSSIKNEKMDEDLRDEALRLHHDLSPRQIDIVCAGGLVGHWQRCRKD